MPIASRRARKRRRQKQQVNNQRLEQALAGALGKNLRLANIAVEEHEKSKNLARLLITVAMSAGGELVIPDADVAEVPHDAKLLEEYDAARGVTIIRAVVPKTEPESLIKVVPA